MENLKLKHFSDTVIGKVRKGNEDAIGSLPSNEIKDNGNLFIVCDGMGGHVGGAIASTTAVERIKEYFKIQYHSDPINALKEAIKFANQQIFLRSQVEPELKGMGTTCTVLLQRENKIFIAHVGDSRIYINTDKKLFRITKDHSVVQGLVDLGKLTDDKMETHPRKNELTKAVGIAENINVEVSDRPILAKKGDQFLMCSDGLCGLVNDLTISSTLNSHSDITKAGNELINLAMNAGGNDNISVDLIEVLESPNPASRFIDKSNVKVSLSGTQEVIIEPEVHVTPSLQKYKTVLLSCMLLIVLGLGAFFILNNGEEETPKDGPLIAKIKGCMDPDADNYEPKATFEDGSCIGVIIEDERQLTYKLIASEGFLAASDKMRKAVEDEGYIYNKIKAQHIKYVIQNGKTFLKFKEASARYMKKNDPDMTQLGDYFYVNLNDIPEEKECKSDIAGWKRQGYKTGKIKWAKATESKRCGVTYYLYTAEDRALEVKRKQEEKNIKKLVTDHKAIKFTAGSGLKGKKVRFYVNKGQHQNKDRFGITKTHFKNEERARLNPTWAKYIVLDSEKACDSKDHKCETHDCKEGCPKFVPKKLDIRVNPIHEKKGHECNESCSEFVPKEIDVSKYTPEKGWLKKKIVWVKAGDKKVVGDVTYYKYSKIDIALDKKYNSELNAISKFKNNRGGVKGSKFSTGWDKVWFFCQSHDNKANYGVSRNNFTNDECKRIGEKFMQKWAVKVKKNK